MIGPLLPAGFLGRAEGVPAYVAVAVGDLTAAQGWTPGGKASVAYASNETTITNVAGTGVCDIYHSMGGEASGLKMVTFLVKTSQANWFVTYKDTYAGPSQFGLTIPGDGLWQDETMPDPAQSGRRNLWDWKNSKRRF